MLNTIAILIPCKNAALYLEECLTSILNQTYSNWTCTIIDDKSDDDSKIIAENFQERDCRFKSITNSGYGIIKALQTGYKNCKEDFISRMDADDIMMPEKMESMIQLLLDTGRGTVVCGKVKYFTDSNLGNGYIKYQNWINAGLESENTFSDIYKECVIPSPSWMMYRDDFDLINGFSPVDYPEDYDLAFRMYQNQLKVLGTQEVVHLWRDYPNRTSRTDEHYSDNSFIDIKVKYFLKIDRKKDKALILWGAGKKGKKVAKLLIKEGLPFFWLSNNPKKIGHNIYGKFIKSSESLSSILEAQILLAVANPQEISEIKTLFKNNDTTQIFFFA